MIDLILIVRSSRRNGANGQRCLTRNFGPCLGKTATPKPILEKRDRKLVYIYILYHVYIYAIYIYTHTYIHTYIHTHIYICCMMSWDACNQEGSWWRSVCGPACQWGVGILGPYPWIAFAIQTQIITERSGTPWDKQIHKHSNTKEGQNT